MKDLLTNQGKCGTIYYMIKNTRPPKQLTLTFRLTKEQKEFLIETSNRRDVTISQVLRDCIDTYGNRVKYQKQAREAMFPTKGGLIND